MSKKTIFLVRHAESAENVKKRAAKCGFGRLYAGKGLPSLDETMKAAMILQMDTDSELSEQGCKMIEEIRLRVEEDNFVQKYAVELVVHSHYVRAKKTCLGIFTSPCAVNQVPIMEHDILYEKTPLEYVWTSNFNDRIQQFNEWLAGRPESVIVVAGHGAFFKKMLGVNWHMQNCDIVRVEFNPEVSTSDYLRDSAIQTTPWGSRTQKPVLIFRSELSCADEPLLAGAAAAEHGDGADDDAVTVESPPLTKKRLFLIRNSASNENDRVSAAKSGIGRLLHGEGVPTLHEAVNAAQLLRLNMNSQLSELGVQIASEISARLEADDFVAKNAIDLLVSSPMFRATQTLQIIFPEKLRGSIPVVESAALIERTATEYVWSSSFTARISSFVSWLSFRPETNIVVIGHGGYFREMLGAAESLRVSDVATVEFDPLAPEERQFGPASILYRSPLAPED